MVQRSICGIKFEVVRWLNFYDFYWFQTVTASRIVKYAKDISTLLALRIESDFKWVKLPAARKDIRINKLKFLLVLCTRVH